MKWTLPLLVHILVVTTMQRVNLSVKKIFNVEIFSRSKILHFARIYFHKMSILKFFTWMAFGELIYIEVNYVPHRGFIFVSDPVTQFLSYNWPLNQPTFRCSNSAMETPKQFVKFVQRHQNDVFDVILVSLLLTLNRFQTPIRYFFR